MTRSPLVQGRRLLRAARRAPSRTATTTASATSSGSPASSATSRSSGWTASGSCRSSARRCATTATTSPTTARSTRTTGRWPTSTASSRRPTATACGSSRISWSTTPPTSTRGSRPPAAQPDSPYRDYYVWSDTDERYRDARIIFLDTEHVELDVGSGGQGLLLAPLLPPPARSQLRQPAGPPRAARRHALLAGQGPRRLPLRRGALSLRARGHQLREPARDPRVPARDPPHHRRASTRGASSWPRRTSGPPTSAPTSATATSSTWRSTSR